LDPESNNEHGIKEFDKYVLCKDLSALELDEQHTIG
jgi:hypothetical protein